MLQKHFAMYPKNKIKVIYKFDPTIPNWRERLASAYEMLFQKIEEMESGKRLNGEEMEGKDYGGQIIPQV